MPRNSSGIYSLPTGNPVITDTAITEVWGNTTMADIGNEITNSLPRNGSAGMTGPFNLLGNASGALEAVPLQQVVQKAGDTMTGQLKGITPVSAEDLTRKDYVDNLLSTPAFKAHNATSQSYVGATINLVQLPTEDYDPFNYFNANRFTPLKAGWYQITGAINPKLSGGLTSAVAYIYKNGVSQKRADFYTGTAIVNVSVTIEVTDLVFLNGTTDYIELWGFMNGSGTGTFYGLDATWGSSLSGFLVVPT